MIVNQLSCEVRGEQQGRLPMIPPTINPGGADTIEPLSAKRGSTIPNTAVQAVAMSSNKREAVKWVKPMKVSVPRDSGWRPPSLLP